MKGKKEKQQKRGKKTTTGANAKFDFSDPQNIVRIEGWARDGLDDKQIAEIIGYNQTYFCELKAKHPELGEALKKGRAPLDIVVENSLYRRATKGTMIKTQQAFKCKEVTFNLDGTKTEREEIRIVDLEQEIPPDTTAQIFWLKNRKPEYWNKQPIRIDTTTNGKELENKELVFLPAESLTSEQIEKFLGNDTKPGSDDTST